MQRNRAYLLIGAVLGLTVLSIGSVWATTSYLAHEAENGTVSSSASVVADSSASGNQAVKFGQSGSVACGNSTEFAPGGPDPWGGCWPGPANTGVPTGTSLTDYTGPCTITTDGTTIDSKTIDCGPLVIRASNVIITNSHINDGINIETAYCSSASLAIADSLIDMPATVSEGNRGGTGLMRCNYTANRVNVAGGRRSMYCVSNCTIENSWVHGQAEDGAGGAHFSGIRMEQDGVFRHNSITCEAISAGPGSGCSAGLTGYGDYAAVVNNLIEKNLFYRGVGSSFGTCAYGGSSPNKPYSEFARDVRFIDNRFVRSPSGHCGTWAAILHYDSSRPGNVVQGNLYDDGGVAVGQFN